MMPISPSVVWATTNVPLPDHSRRSTATSSTVISATATPRDSPARSAECTWCGLRSPRASLLGQLVVLLLQVLQATDAQERLLRVVVELALRSEEHTSELQSRENLVCRLLLEKKK